MRILRFDEIMPDLRGKSWGVRMRAGEGEKGKRQNRYAKLEAERSQIIEGPPFTTKS
jgi:hypothetical protein